MTETTTPIAWMVYTLDGKSAFVTDNPADFTQAHQALPLYTTPPQREPLTEKQIESAVCAAYVEKALTRYDIAIARAIERAHGIGGEE